MGNALSGCKTEVEAGVTTSQVQEAQTQESVTPLAVEQMLTIQEFGEKVIEVLQKDRPNYEFQWKDGGTITVSEKGDVFLTLNLVNAYNDYSVKGLKLDDVLDNYTNSASDLIQRNEDESSGPILTRESIMATIKTSDYIEFVREQGIEPVCDELVEGLYILYMHDQPNAAKAFTEAELAEAGIERSEVRDLAVKNLTETLIPHLTINEVDGVYLTAADGMYESGLILCDIWDLYPVENDYVIGIPERSYLIIADSKNVEAIENMEAAGQYLFDEASYPITDKLLYWNGSEFSYLAR